jgi:hypothetical protein
MHALQHLTVQERGLRWDWAVCYCLLSAPSPDQCGLKVFIQQICCGKGCHAALSAKDTKGQTQQQQNQQLDAM